MTMTVTKHNFMVTDIRDLPSVIHQAFQIATSGRPGPVLIDLPKDVMTNHVTEHDKKDKEIRSFIVPKIKEKEIHIIAEKINNARSEERRVGKESRYRR